MRRVIIVAAGGHAAEIDDYILFFNELQINISSKLNVVGFIDDNPKSYERYNFNRPYLGEIKDPNVERNVHYIITR